MWVSSASSRFLDGLEGAGRRPAGVHVRKIERIELRPQNIAFGAKRGMGKILLLAGAGVFHAVGESELSVFGGLREAALEIVERGNEPGIVLAHAVHAKGNEFVAEEFGEG